jgi:DNA polymerase III subunit delta
LNRGASRSGLQEEQAIARLNESPVQPLYLFYGREGFFIRRCLDALRRRILPSPDLCDVLCHSFHGAEADVEGILTVAQSPPFFHERQLIVVREAEKIKETGLAKLLAYAENPAPATCAVFVTGEKLPGHNLFKVLKNSSVSTCLEFPALNKVQQRKWVEAIAREKGIEKRLSPAILRGFLEEGYVSLEIIETRLEMLALYLAGEKDGPGDDPLPPEWSEGTLGKGFLFTDALLQGDRQGALVLLHRFLEQGDPPVLILARIQGEIRRILQLQEARRRGQAMEAVLGAARVPPFKRKQYLSLAAGVPASAIHRLLFSVLEKDRAIKSSRMNLQWHLEDLCLQFTAVLEGVPSGGSKG